MKILITCPYCKRLLFRDLEDILSDWHEFACDCTGRKFKIKLMMSYLLEDISDLPLNPTPKPPPPEWGSEDDGEEDFTNDETDDEINDYY